MECTCVNNDDFTVLVSGSSRHCWVSMCTVWPSSSKWLSKKSNESASNFALNLNIPPQKLLGWFRSLELWATGDQQLHHNNAPTLASCLLHRFLVKHQITQVTQHPYSPDLVPCDFWFFQKVKSLLKGKRVEIMDDIQENMMGRLMEIGRTVWCPRMPTLNGTEALLSYVQCFLYLVSSAINISIYIVHAWIPYRQTMCVSVWLLLWTWMWIYTYY